MVNGEVVLNDAGRLVKQVWLEIPEHFHGTNADTFVIMLNHDHRLIMIDASVGAGLRAHPGCEGHSQGGATTHSQCINSGDLRSNRRARSGDRHEPGGGDCRALLLTLTLCESRACGTYQWLWQDGAQSQ